jgi:hypothetical protein
LVENPMGLMRALRAINATEVARMQRALATAREQILFQTGDGRKAVDNLLGEVDACMHPEALPSKPFTTSSGVSSGRSNSGSRTTGLPDSRTPSGRSNSGSDPGGPRASLPSVSTDSVDLAVSPDDTSQTVASLKQQQVSLLPALGALRDRLAAVEQRRRGGTRDEAGSEVT